MSISAKDTYDPIVSSPAGDLSSDEKQPLLIPIPQGGQIEASNEESIDQGCWQSIAQKSKEIAQKVWNSISFTPESNDSPQNKNNSISSPSLSTALMQELTNPNQLSKLRATSQPVIPVQDQSNSKEDQHIAMKFISDFFMDSYKNIPQKLPFQENLLYEKSQYIALQNLSLPDIDITIDNQSFELQNGDRIRHVALINKIASILIPRPHYFYVEAIPDLLDILLSEPTNAANSHLIEVLKTLMNTIHLQEKLTTIPTPPKGSPGEMLIRLSLNLPQDHSVTSLETQQAALAALLSYCRQGKSGTCFATFLTIALKASNLEVCLDDFTSLIINSSLTRKHNGKTLIFPLNMSMSKEQLNQSLSVYKNGALSTNGDFVWDSSGFSAACRALNIDNPAEVITKILTSDPLQVQPITITVDDLLKEIAKVAKPKDFQDDWIDLYLLATTAYESQTYNPLLRAWENALAGMAEGTENGFIKPQIIDSILFALERKLIHSIPQNPRLEKEIENVIQLILQNRIQLQFSPDIVHGRSDDDGNSQQGAFVVYDTNNSKHSSHWQLVDDATKFQGFIQIVLKETQERLRDYPANESVYGPCLSALSTYVSTDEFVLQSVKKCGYYQPKNSPAKFDNIDTSPWMFKTGTNPKKVLQIYFEMEKPPLPKTLSFRNATTLITKVAENIKAHTEWLSVSTSSQIHLPAAIQGLHVFSLIPKEPTLQPLLNEQVNIAKWLEDNVESPGREISLKPIPEQHRNQIIDDCKKLIEPIDNLTQFQDAIIQIKSESSVKDFREEVLTLLRLYAGKDEPIARLALELDAIMIKNLPKGWVKDLTDRAIHFGDTNWYDGNRDIHFCVMVNPGTGQLELWKINEDNSNPTPIDQNYWLRAHQWEFFII